MHTNKLSIAIATAALVVAALGSTPLGHAAGQLILPKSSVGTLQLKSGAVTGLKVKDGSLAAADFAAGQLPVGPKGEKGDPGAQGPKGDSGATKVTIRAGNLASAALVATSTAQCLTGETLVGGGATSTAGNVNGQPVVQSSTPTQSGWYVVVKNIGNGGDVLAKAYALCSAP